MERVRSRQSTSVHSVRANSPAQNGLGPIGPSRTPLFRWKRGTDGACFQPLWWRPRPASGTSQKAAGGVLEGQWPVARTSGDRCQWNNVLGAPAEPMMPTIVCNFAHNPKRQRDLHVRGTGILLDSFLSPCKDLHYANSPQYPHSP
jgi:hypothetical protein